MKTLSPGSKIFIRGDIFTYHKDVSDINSLDPHEPEGFYFDRSIGKIFFHKPVVNVICDDEFQYETVSLNH